MINANCPSCTSPCKSCIDNSTKCLSCVDGYYLETNLCIKCPNKFNKCTSATVGTECAIGIGRSTNLPNCECNSHYFDNNTN